MKQWVWIRDVPASVTWLLIVKYLPIHKDNIKLILGYLFKKEIFYGEVPHMHWSMDQYKVYSTLYLKEQTTMIRMGPRCGKKTTIAGITANLMMTKKNYKVCIITHNLIYAYNLITMVNDMVNGKLVIIEKNSDSIHYDNNNYFLSVQP